MARTIESPGVEIREIDLSNISTLPVGTQIFLQGFCASGPINELVNITSVAEFESVYGLPTNAAERFSYQSARQVLQSPGRLVFNRLPYGSGAGEGTGSNYSVLAFPHIAFPTATTPTVDNDSSYIIDYTKSSEYQGVIIGEPTLITLTKAEYESLKQGDLTGAGSSSAWLSGYDSRAGSPNDGGIQDKTDLYKAAVIVSNDFRTAIDTDNSGYYIAVTDNTNLTDLEYSKIKNVRSRNASGDNQLGNSEAPNDTTSLTFNLTSDNSGNSVSQIVETSNGTNFGSAAYNDLLQFSLFRLRPTFLESAGGDVLTSLSQSLVATTVGSIDVNRQDTILTGDGVASTIFLDTTVEDNGRGFISATVNPILAASFDDKIVRTLSDPGAQFTQLSLSAIGFDTETLVSAGSGGVLNTIVNDITSGDFYSDDMDQLFSIGDFEPCTDKDFKTIGNTVQKIDRGFRLADNRDLVPLDIVIDGGLTTIEAISNEISSGNLAPELGGKDIYDDTVYADMVSSSDAKDNAFESWKAVYNLYETFCEDTRGDCMFIVDPLRNIFVQGTNRKVSTNDSYSFSTDILVPARTLIESANSNYGAVYGNWVRATDIASGERYWYPFSGYQAGIMARLDSVQQPWFPPAGLNNGQIPNITDLAFEPNQRERDLLYRYNINPITLFPGDGFVVMGQKTLQTKPSAFDRINVRRLFLTLEKATRRVARYFVMELNTAFTRARLVNVLTPIFENAKNNQGVYDYLIVCDERNNTPDVIDRNELAVDIYLKPTRAAEFILINFIATRTGDDFSEILI